MRRPLLLAAANLALATGLAAQQTTGTSAPSASPVPAAAAYPAAERDTVVDDYFGTRVPAPYRWMEDPNDPHTKAWIDAETEFTARALGRLPTRETIRQRLTALWNYQRTSVPFRVAGRIFYRKNSGLQRQAPLYERARVDAPERLLLDPNALSPDGSVALQSVSVSPDGRRLAYGLAEGGSDFQTWHVRDLAAGRELADTIRWVKFSDAQWTHDDRGFFYTRYPEPKPGQELSGANRDPRIYYHALGTPQAQDRLIYERPDHPEWFLGATVSEDGRWLWLYVSSGGTKNQLFYADLRDPDHPALGAAPRPISAVEDAEYAPLGNVGDTLFLRTDWQAPNRRLVAVALGTPDDTARARWRTVVPEGREAIEAATLAGGRLVVQHLVDVKSRLTVYDRTGRRQGEIALPGIGSVQELSARNDTPELWYTFTSFLYPTTVFRYDLRAGSAARPASFEAPRTAFDASRYETTQVFYTSKDGTRVPMFVTARKGLARDGANPTLLYAYGGFDISITPSYSPAVAQWLEMGGVYAVPNLRGGGEYGEAWHEAGMREKKQNVFDDFIAAAEYLVRERWTSPTRLAVQGRSNGGLLIGAAITQRPDLFGVALPAVGVMDMLRYQKFTGGHFWVPEYGSSDDSTAFRYLARYSPLQNIRPGTCYPATLLTTADHDDRVVPSHTFQFGAALQAAQARAPNCDRPILVRIERAGSHGYRPTDRQIDEVADLWAFTAAHLRMTPSTPTP